MLCLDAGGIQPQFLLVRVTRRLSQSQPDTRLAPTIKASPHTVPVTEAFGHVSPGDACFADEEHGIDEEAIVFATATAIAFFTCDERFDSVPLPIRQVVPTKNDPPP